MNQQRKAFEKFVLTKTDSLKSWWVEDAWITWQAAQAAQSVKLSDKQVPKESTETMLSSSIRELDKEVKQLRERVAVLESRNCQSTPAFTPAPAWPSTGDPCHPPYKVTC